MNPELVWIIGLFVLGGGATGAALILSVVSLHRSVEMASRRPEVAKELNREYFARLEQLRLTAQSEARAEGRGDELNRMEEDMLAVATATAEDEFKERFTKAGMLPNSYANELDQHYAESQWQLSQTLKPQKWSTVLLIVGTVLETTASIWALFVVL